jgi:hypothetical protein
LSSDDDNAGGKKTQAGGKKKPQTQGDEDELEDQLRDKEEKAKEKVAADRLAAQTVQKHYAYFGLNNCWIANGCG